VSAACCRAHACVRPLPLSPPAVAGPSRLRASGAARRLALFPRRPTALAHNSSRIRMCLDLGSLGIDACHRLSGRDSVRYFREVRALTRRDPQNKTK
jgi:hypothetical protein